MASAPQPTLPLFYNDLMPLNSRDHSKYKSQVADTAPFMANQHAIPLTVDEFVEAQRSFPIVFSSGDNPLPLGLMGLNEGVNTFMDDKGKPLFDGFYMPAYVRRYPFMLAKLKEDSEEMSLCFDPTAPNIGEFKDGNALFEKNKEPSEMTKGVLQFCERFEESGQRTKAFIEQLKNNDLLMEGEIAITQADKPDTPFVYRGFQMVNEEKLKELSGPVLEEWNKNGLMLLIHAHLFSLNLMRTIFGRQVQQGKGPEGASGSLN